MPKIFVSRKLEDTSILKSGVYTAPIDWTDRSLIQFECVEFDIPQNGWLFFYSKTGVDFFHEKKGSLECNLKSACYGHGTAEKYKSVTGKNADFIGTGEGISTAESFFSHAIDQEVHFIAGRQSRRILQKLYGDLIKGNDVTVYNNMMIRNVNLGHFHIAILTSPLNAEAFFQNKGYADHFISIGNTTATHLNMLGKNSLVAQEPSEAGIQKCLYTTLARL